MSHEPIHTGMTDMTDRPYMQTQEQTIVGRQDCEDRGPQACRNWAKCREAEIAPFAGARMMSHADRQARQDCEDRGPQACC